MKKRLVHDALEPITSTPKERSFCTIDVESKSGDTQEPGFTRPFLVGLYDPDPGAKPRRRGRPKKEASGDDEPVKRRREPEYQEFRNEPHLADREWRSRHFLPGGCVDKLLTTILTKRYAGRIFYAHNGGNFDWLFLLAWLRLHEDEYGIEVVPIQTTIQVIRVWRLTKDGEDEKTRERWEFHDSMRLFPRSLASMCETFKVPGKVEHDLAMHENDPRWSVYLRQDCVALATAMRRLYELVTNRLGGEVGITAPSTAMKLFRRKFMGRDGVPDRIERHRHWPGCRDGDACLGCAHEWGRRGYYGGRTEAFEMLSDSTYAWRGTSWRRVGPRSEIALSREGEAASVEELERAFAGGEAWLEEGGVHYFDVNSSYVASMLEMMPVGRRYIDEGRLDWSRHSSRGGGMSGFVECTVEVPEDCPLPPLPHVNQDTGKLCFPVGRFHGVWSVEELLLLADPLVGGRIVHVTKAVWYELLPMFAGMVEELWELRNPQCRLCRPEMQARGSREPCPHYDEGLSQLAKLLGNSTYGKFAMKHERTTIVRSPKEPAAETCCVCGETSTTPICSRCEGSKPASGEPDSDLWYQKRRADAPYIIPHIAAHITALSRVRLWMRMRDAITTRGRARPAIALKPRGDVVFLSILGAERWCIVSRVEPSAKLPDGLRVHGRCEVDGRTVRTTLDLDPRSLLVHGGHIMYCDTDSALTDVVIETGINLGEMKDEFPGELLDFVCLQPKLYMLQRRSLNTDLAWRRCILQSALAGDDAFDASTLDRATERGPLRKAPLGFRPLSAKVTAKGFDQDLKTQSTFTALARGETIRSRKDRRTGAEVPWERLEKVRTLARRGFRDSPAMRAVEKSMRSAYDKRTVLLDGIRTVPIVLHEPVGGYALDEAAE